ncbi:DUF6976 family protein [Mesoterricola silvestris]|uniref:Uncharacterized protein n=1 Tax=Mesoterricola silvestris TaxID=2927979 RepID=A0AA48GYQ1_9BACT|nr:hypothetical protein [Mesoterricola silvestris]BDU72808.1 hypothetical protein METEAL_19820 [Mesoterricola silvestris]
MKKSLLTPEETAALIRTGRFLALAADEAVLRALPRGNWVGGTTPYFVGDEGGLMSRERVHVAELAEAGTAATLVDYDLAGLTGIAGDGPDNGFTFVIIPALSALHQAYASGADEYPGMFMTPLVGWIAGVHLDDLGKVSPKVINGLTGKISDAMAVAMHVPLPPRQLAMVRILNLFHPGDGDVLTFPEGGFTVTDCFVNGKPARFAEYVEANRLDLARPLVADYNGARINTSFQAVEGGKVRFYAPVFTGVEYRHAAPVGDYVHELEALAADLHVAPRFSCNCILNYLYGKLEGRRTGDLTGPVTFGEIGYQLLNQTLVYLEVVNKN